MKNKILIIGILGLLLAACDMQKPVAEVVYDQYNKQDGFSMLILPPSFIDNFVDKSKTDQQDLLKSLRDLRLMTFDDAIANKSQGSVYADIVKLLDKRGFEEYINVNKEGSGISVRCIEKNGTIKEMHVLIRGEEKFFMASLNGKIDLNKVNSTINDWNLGDLSTIEDITDDFDFSDFEWAF